MSDPNFTPRPSAATESDRGAAATMSTPETLSGIFFEPGATFEALRQRPRFLVAGIILLVATMAFIVMLYQRIGYENMVRQAVENSPRTADMPAEQKERAIAMQTGPVFKTIAYVSPVIGISIFIALGAALYLLGAMVMGGGISYKQALAVWVYSSMPPGVLVMIANLVLLFIKSPEDISPENAQRGLVHANPSLLIDTAAHPVLGTALGALDLFAIYGLVLAAIGLRKVGRLNSTTAWTIVIAIWLIGVLVRVALAAVTGSPMA